MPRKRINKEPLSNAEKQRRYREKKKAQGKKRTWTDTALASAPDLAVLREEIKKELRASWEPELKQARIEAERKKGRELAKQADRTFTQARTIGICETAAYFIGKDRVDIAQHLLNHFMIDRETAEAALQADKRVKSITLESLDKSGAWKRPPLMIK